MRDIFPKNNSTNILGKEGDIVKKEDLLPIINQLNETKQVLEVLIAQFDEYKEGQQISINISTLNAITSAITTLNTTLANLDTADINNLFVSGLAELTTLSAQIATITSTLSAINIESSLLETQNLTANEGAINELEVGILTVDNWHVENVTIDNIIATQKVETSQLKASSSELGVIKGNYLALSGDANFGRNIRAIDSVFKSISTDKIDVKNISWKSSVSLSNIESFFIEVPHFENGQYYIQLVDDFTSFATIEIFNSVDNYFVRWSQSENGNIQNIFKHGDGVSSRIFIEFKNISGKSLKLKYGTICMNSDENCKIHKLLSIKPDVTYKVKHINGSKFFENVDFTIDKQQIIDIIREINPTIFIDELRNKENNKTEKSKKRKNHDGRIIRK